MRIPAAGDRGAAARRSHAAQVSPPRTRKRARGMNAAPAPPVVLWRETRGTNGQVIISLDSDSDEDYTAPESGSDVRAPPLVHVIDSDSEGCVKVEPESENSPKIKRKRTVVRPIDDASDADSAEADEDEDEEADDEDEDEEGGDEDAEEEGGDDNDAEEEGDGAEESGDEQEDEEEEWQPEVVEQANGNGEPSDGSDSDVVIIEPTQPANPTVEPVIKQEPLIKVEPVVSSTNSVNDPRISQRAWRRSVLRRRRLDEDRAGVILFSGRKYVPSATVLKHLIEFVARCAGPMTENCRQWVEFLLLARLNTAVDRQSVDFDTRFPDWMKIALGDVTSTTSRVQREAILPRPMRHTIRALPATSLHKPSPVADASKRKVKTQPQAAKAKAAKQKNNTKWLEKRATELQGTGKRSTAVAKSQPPRRVVSVGTPANSGPFSPSSSTASPSTRGRGTPTHEQPERKRRRLFSPVITTCSPSAAPTMNGATPPSLDLSGDGRHTSGVNRSMPQDWTPAIGSRARPLSMSPLQSMSPAELKAHIQSVHQDGRARSVERPMELLLKLMTHPRNRHNTFNRPVDPVALKLPTYFDVIKRPMDLGTIKLRLEEGEYLTQDDFEADVRLVFTNAMQFNPPNHSVHVDAEFLLRLFDHSLHDESLDRVHKRRSNTPPPPPTAAADRHACHACLGHTCAMCAQGCQPLAQPQLQCAGSCGTELRRGSTYYATRDGTRIWCSKCRVTHVRTASSREGSPAADASSHATPPDHSKKKKRKKKLQQQQQQAGGAITVVEIDGELVPKRVEGGVEPWVQCARCARWLHQVCGLFNPVAGAHAATHEYVCPLCTWRQHSDNDKPPPATPDRESSCHQIPSCELSQFIEAFLQRGLRDLGEATAADELHVRVLTFPGEHVVVPDGVVKTFDQNASLLERQPSTMPSDLPRHRFPAEIPFTSRGIYLFQRHDGADVCLFTLFVQEFDAHCTHAPNRKSVYVAYLDSIRYLKPPSARTAAYHLILMAYFDYIRRHGFERVHIWSCPPQKRISYVFWCRPSFQKTPSAEHLRAWYRRLLTKAQDAGIVQSWTNMYDRYFDASETAAILLPLLTSHANGSGEGAATRGATSRSTAVDPADHVWPTSQLPPLFDGDFIPSELERILGRLAARNDKYRRGSIGGAGKSSAVGTSGGKIAVGDMVARIQEEKEPATVATAASLETKLNDVFVRCKQAVQRLKNDLLVVDLVVVAGDEAPPPEVPPWSHTVPRFFGSRFMFHQLCATASYQFDSLPRAKHATMMLFHHFWNQDATQLNVFCSDCFLLITHVDYWRCESCPRFALCDLCHRRDGASHAHGLVFGAERNDH